MGPWSKPNVWDGPTAASDGLRRLRGPEHMWMDGWDAQLGGNPGLAVAVLHLVRERIRRSLSGLVWRIWVWGGGAARTAAFSWA